MRRAPPPGRRGGREVTPVFGELLPEYERELENFDDEIDMCNQLGLNYDEIYKDPEDMGE